LAAASDDNIKLWNRNGSLAIVLKARKDKFTSVSFSPTGRLLASGSNKGNLILQNLTSTKIENLLSESCYLLHDYFQTNPKVTKSDKALCSP
jgi:WD40 repeat protein